MRTTATAETPPETSWPRYTRSLFQRVRGINDIFFLFIINNFFYYFCLFFLFFFYIYIILRVRIRYCVREPINVHTYYNIIYTNFYTMRKFPIYVSRVILKHLTLVVLYTSGFVITDRVRICRTYITAYTIYLYILLLHYELIIILCFLYA